MKRALRWAPQLTRRASLSTTAAAAPDPRSTAYYRITPTTKTEVVAHDVKAASITKALYIDCLPPVVSAQPMNKEFHRKFKETYMEAMFFEPTQRIMPLEIKWRHKNWGRPGPSTRLDRKPAHLVAESIYCQVLQYLHMKIPGGFIKDTAPQFCCAFNRLMPGQLDGDPHTETFLVEGELAYEILGDKPLSTLFSLEDCRQTEQLDIQWETVIDPRIDIEKHFRMESILPVTAPIPSYPYTRLIMDVAGAAEWSDSSRARGIYFLFARLVSEALRDGAKFGEPLEKPRVGCYVSCSGFSVHVVYYQLNTLDLTSEGGMKNLAWGESVEEMTSSLVPFQKVTPEALLGPGVLEDAADLIKRAMFWDCEELREEFIP